MRVQRHHEQLVAEHREAAIHRRLRAIGEIGGQLAPILPERTACLRIERPREVVRAGDVEDAVPEKRCRLEAAAARQRAGLIRPLRHEPMDVVRCQRGQRTVALSGVVARERQPSRGVGEAREQFRESSPADAHRGPSRRCRLPTRSACSLSLKNPCSRPCVSSIWMEKASSPRRTPLTRRPSRSDERHRLRRGNLRRGRRPPARRRPEARGISGTRRSPSARRRERSTAASRCRARLDESSGRPVRRWRPTPTARRAPDRCRRAHRRRGRPHTARRRASRRCGHPGRAAGAAR